jgi:hypothetical protein
MEKMIMVGDRGMITTARIKDVRKAEGMAWITCLRHPAIKKLMADDGPLQLSLFDQQDLAEITSPDFPTQRRAFDLIGTTYPSPSRRHQLPRQTINPRSAQ